MATIVEQDERELETLKLFQGIYRRVASARASRHKDKINVPDDISEIAEALSRYRNLLNFSMGSNSDLIHFAVYSINMVRVFSIFAFNDWIVRHFFESLQLAEGEVREKLYKDFRYYIFPKSRDPISRGKDLGIAKEYGRLYPVLRKLLKGVKTRQNAYLLIRERFPAYKDCVISGRGAIEVYFDRGHISEMALYFLANKNNLSVPSAVSALTRGRKLLNK